MIRSQNYIFFILLLFLLPILTGCPYESTVALGEKDMAIFDPDLLGTWYDHRPNNISKSIITRHEGNEYKIRHYRESNNKIDINEFHAYITKVGDNYFVNVYEPSINFTKGGFLIFKIEKTNANSIRLTELDRYKTPTDLNDRQKLHQFIKENINNSFIFNSSMVLKKEES